MSTSSVTERFATLDQQVPVDEYNYAHFRTIHLLRDVQRTREWRGVPPDAVAPDFELPRADGGSLRLRDVRGTPVLLHFGSWS